jgi:hypothetical protein
MFVVINPDHFKSNSSLQRRKNQLHLPSVKFSSIQKGATYSAIKMFNKLALNLSKLHTDSISFKPELKKFIVKDAFFSIEEFLSLNCDVN